MTISDEIDHLKKFSALRAVRARICKQLGWDVWLDNLVVNERGAYIEASLYCLESIASELEKRAATLSESSSESNGG